MTAPLFAIYGEPKVGKTWLAATAPKPMLILDVEAGGADYIPVPKVKWTPGDPLMRVNGNWDAAVVDVRSVQAFEQLMQQFTQNADMWPFRSVCIDSLTELQARARRSLCPSGDMDMQAWGKLLSEMERVITGLRDLTVLVPQVECTIMVCGSKIGDDGKMRPSLQGAAASTLAYSVDALLYLYLAPSQTDLGKTDRIALTAPKPHAQAGNRFGGILPDLLLDPDLSAIVGALKSGQIGESNEQHEHQLGPAEGDS